LEKIEAKLDRHWQKPKGMHLSTRERLVSRIIEIEMMRDDIMNIVTLQHSSRIKTNTQKHRYREMSAVSGCPLPQGHSPRSRKLTWALGSVPTRRVAILPRGPPHNCGREGPTGYQAIDS
jgi:hypothetical protein